MVPRAPDSSRPRTASTWSATATLLSLSRRFVSATATARSASPSTWRFISTETAPATAVMAMTTAKAASSLRGIATSFNQRMGASISRPLAGGGAPLELGQIHLGGQCAHLGAGLVGQGHVGLAAPGRRRLVELRLVDEHRVGGNIVGLLELRLVGLPVIDRKSTRL